MSKKKISLSFIRDNLDKPKKRRRKKKKVRTNEWNTVMDVSIKTLSHQHTISEDEEDYIVFGELDENPLVNEVSQTQIRQHQENSQTLKSPISRQPVIIELTGELHPNTSAEDTWRGNVFGDGSCGIQKNHKSQDFQDSVEQSFASVIEEVHLEEQICQKLHSRYKKEEQEEYNAHIKSNIRDQIDIYSHQEIPCNETLDQEDVSISKATMPNINPQREIWDQRNLYIEQDSVQNEGRTLSSLMQRATKKMQSMISSLDRKAEESMPSFPSNKHLSVLPELLDDDLGTGLHFSIVDSERTDPQLMNANFQPKIQINSASLETEIEKDSFLHSELKQDLHFDQEEENIYDEEDTLEEEDTCNGELLFDDITEPLEPTDIVVEQKTADNKIVDNKIADNKIVEIDSVETVEEKQNQNISMTVQFEEDEYLSEVTIKSHLVTNTSQDIDLCEEYTNDCSLDTIIPVDGSPGSPINVNPVDGKGLDGKLVVDGNSVDNDVVTIDRKKAKHDNPSKNDTAQESPNQTGAEQEGMEEVSSKIECTEDFFDKTLEMALIEEAQGLEKEAKIEIPPSEVFETTGKEQQKLNLHNKVKKTKEADTSLSANLKISQGVAAAKRHLDHLFQREISQEGSGGTDSEKEIHNNSIAFDLKGIDEVTEWERTITDIAQAHQLEIRHMCIFSILFFALGLLPYSHSSLSAYQPWIPGEPLPLLGSFIQHGNIVEGSDGSLAFVDDSEEESDIENDINQVDKSSHETQKEEPAKEKSAFVIVEETMGLGETNSISKKSNTPKKSRSPIALPESRFPARSEEIFIPTGALDYYFTMLSQVENQVEGTVARALVWGDSTIASDGIIKDVRNRMFDEFGDSGPGFLAVHVDPRWSLRRDIYRKPSRGWSTSTIVHGGSASDNYGLAGTVSHTSTDAYSVLAGPKREDGRQEIKRVQVFYETAPNGGSFSVEMVDRKETKNTKSSERTEGYMEVSSGGGRQVTLQAHGDGDVTIYGVALENNQTGVTWETFGVAGSSVQSMKKQSKSHLHTQVVHRNPSLIVYWTGGNELGYPSLRSSTGKGYKKVYRDTVQKLRSGAPTASCLLIGPLDQATRERGEIISKPALEKLIRFQKEVAEEIGCAYWDARSAMGGKGSFKRWLQNDPPYANSDLAHLTGRGRRVIGETLADMLMYSYHNWKVDNPELQWSPEESIRDYPLHMNFLESLPADYLPPIQEELGQECDILVRSNSQPAKMNIGK